MNKRCKNLNSELPNCVLSCIFSKLTLKDLVKTSTLSKHWLHEWGLRIDLNFDFQNMFDSNTLQELPKDDIPLFQRLQPQFATRLDQFMLHYQGAVINSIRLNFPLGDEHSDVIDRLISQGIAKGVKRIELIFSDKTKDTDFVKGIARYEFSFTLLSKINSLMHLHLAYCRIVRPMDFSGLRNLRTLVLCLIGVKQDLLQGLFSNCIHLEDFTLDDCDVVTDLKIISPTLLNLNIVNCAVYYGENIDIIASNLLSFEYSCKNNEVHTMKIKAHMVSQFSFKGRKITQPIGFSGLKNVTTVVLDELYECLQTRVLPQLFKECLQLEDLTLKNCLINREIEITNPKLRHLKIIDCGRDDLHPYKITIDALNLLSFEYSGNRRRIFYVTAPSLLKVFWNAIVKKSGKSVVKKSDNCLGPIPILHQIEDLAMITSHSQIAKLNEVFGQFRNLKQLELFIDEADNLNMGYFSLLDLLMSSQHLQKLSLTIRNSPELGLKREHPTFFHKDLKYVELHGCVCTINAIEFARHLLRNVNSLKKITFGSLDKFYIGAGRWTKGSNSYWFERNFIHERLKDEVKGQCQLIIF